MGRGDRGRATDDGVTPSSLPQTAPPDYGQVGHDFTLQAVIGLEKTVAVLNQKIDRLLEDRKEDRAENKEEIKEFRSDFKDFKQNEFRSLSDDVTNLKINWAKVVGGAAIVGAIASFILEIAKAKLGG